MATAALEDEGASRRQVWKGNADSVRWKADGVELYLSIWNSNRSAILSLKEVMGDAEQFIL